MILAAIRGGSTSRRKKEIGTRMVLSRNNGAWPGDEFKKGFLEKKMDTEREKITYTKENFDRFVKVPAVVEQDLKQIISDRMEQCGLYFRVFSRIKTAASMAKKFDRKEYGEDHKLQDLVGVRINVYFDDDVDICRKIMEQTFELLEWSTSDRAEDEFKQIKLNGVFRLPEYLRAQISPATWDMCIDDTFEIQLKTMFFEGWHEIEHDMRYKGEEHWKDYPGFSRFFNSILATLELCDKSMISLFEDLGHELYKSGYWTDMIRSHFRIKIADVPIYPEVQQRLDEDQLQTVDSLAKRVYKTSKPVLIDLLTQRTRRIPINVNTIIALLNDNIFHDSKLSSIFRERDVYNDGREESVGESRPYEMKPLVRHDVFRMRTWVDGSRLRGVENPGTEEIFEHASEAVYNWMFTKYSPIFPEIPEKIGSCGRSTLGYRVEVRYNRDALEMDLHVEHIDMIMGGRLWYTDASLIPDEQGRIILVAHNGYAEPQSEQVSEEEPVPFFSYPGFYKSIVDGIGIRSGIDCFNRRRILKEEQAEALIRAVSDPENRFPVVLIISEKTEDGLMDENWLGQFRVSDFTRTVWRYAHVFTCYEEDGRPLLKRLCHDDIQDPSVPGLYIFWPDGDVDQYGPEDVANCSFGRHLETRDDTRTYDIVHGGQAFYHRIVTELREQNMAMPF